MTKHSLFIRLLRPGLAIALLGNGGCAEPQPHCTYAEGASPSSVGPLFSPGRVRIDVALASELTKDLAARMEIDQELAFCNSEIWIHNTTAIPLVLDPDNARDTIAAVSSAWPGRATQAQEAASLILRVGVCCTDHEELLTVEALSGGRVLQRSVGVMTQRMRWPE